MKPVQLSSGLEAVVSTISPGLGAFFWTGRLTLRYEKRKHSQKRKGRSSSASVGT